jgi:hypothetical protein
MILSNLYNLDFNEDSIDNWLEDNDFIVSTFLPSISKMETRNG